MEASALQVCLGLKFVVDGSFSSNQSRHKVYKSMEVPMRICRKQSKDEHTMRKRKIKNKKVDRFVSLPDDILLDILKRVPNFFLRYKAKYVCRRWFKIITNRILLDHASFILQKGNLRASHVGIREEGQRLQVKVEDIDLPGIGMIRSWCNEFLLISGHKSLYVFNLITKEGAYLPACDAPCGGHNNSTCGVALSFDGFKGIYKVVHLFMGSPIECHILILRKNIVSSKWKKIQFPHLNGGSLYSYNPVSVQGRYFHWEDHRNKCLVSMDMVKEEIVTIRLPGPGDCRGFVYSTFEMGGHLALCGGDDFHKPDIWVLKDFQRKKWEKLQMVTLENWYHKRFPVCGVSKKYIIVECKSDRAMCYYDLNEGVVKKLGIHIEFGDDCVVHSSPPSF